MSTEELTRLLAVIKARYPRANWGEDEDLTIMTWNMTIGDIPLEHVMKVLPGLMRASEFPPDPAAICSAVFSASGQGVDPNVAWGRVQDWLNGGVEFIALPGLIRIAVRDIGGTHNLRNSQRPDNDRRAFIDAYTVRRDEAMTGPDFAQMISTGFLEIGGGS